MSSPPSQNCKKSSFKRSQSYDQRTGLCGGKSLISRTPSTKSSSGTSVINIVHKSQSSPDSINSSYVGVNGQLNGKGFTLKVWSQCDTPSMESNVCVREENPAPFMKSFDGSLFETIQEPDLQPLMFHIEIETSMSCETNKDANGLNLQLMFNKEADKDVQYVILQQDEGSTQWLDITDQCSTTEQCPTTPGSPKIHIPVNKSSKIWVIRLKHSLSSLVHTLLALIHGQVLFRILVYHQVLKKKTKVRIIGISEELYQNPKSLKTAETEAEKEKYVKGRASNPKKLLRKGSLTLELHKAGNCVKSGEFDIGRNDIHKYAQKYDCTFRTDDSMVAKVMDKEGVVLWSIDLNETLEEDDDLDGEFLHVTNALVNASNNASTKTRPEITSFDEEVCEDQIPWLARQLNKDMERIAMSCLQVKFADIESMRRQGESVEQRAINILMFWRETVLREGRTPTWNDIKTVLEREDVLRYDILRILLNEDDVDRVIDDIFTWLPQQVASKYQIYARVLGVPKEEIDLIRVDYAGCQKRQCTAALERWRQRTRTPTVEALLEALESDIIKDYEVANEMRKRLADRDTAIN